MRRFAGLVIPSLVLLTGCPPADQKASSSSSSSSSAPPASAPGACSRIGQSCEFSPGKLGTCVQKDDCKEATACFVCQSQH